MSLAFSDGPTLRIIASIENPVVINRKQEGQV
jgi:hypothetical protein